MGNFPALRVYTSYYYFTGHYGGLMCADWIDLFRLITERAGHRLIFLLLHQYDTAHLQLKKSVYSVSQPRRRLICTRRFSY
jgi:hypothetical protein